jgi:hypothetical protein
MSTGQFCGQSQPAIPGNARHLRVRAHNECQQHNLDTLREGVLTPDIYDLQRNTLYATMLQHYGVVALPCRSYALDLKGVK